MRDDILKRHMRTKHGNTESVVQRGEDHHSQRQATFETEVRAEDVPHDGPLVEDLEKVSNYEDDVSVETDVYDGSLMDAPKTNCADVDMKLEFELTRDNEAYKKNVKLGEQVSIVLHRGVVIEKSLSKQNKFCLELFRAQQPTVDVTSVELRLWQEQLLDIVNEDQKNDRKIIWVKGQNGNEGKSWFQSYLQSLHGTHRVARFDITNKTSDLLHIMSRCELATTDVFLFNQQRCVSSEECCYSLLEMIKDGYASAPKFHGSLLRIRTPNLVVVFANENPRIRALSKDRWRIFNITKDGLTANHEDWLWEKQTEIQTHNESTSRFARGKFTKGHVFGK